MKSYNVYTPEELFAKLSNDLDVVAQYIDEQNNKLTDAEIKNLVDGIDNDLANIPELAEAWGYKRVQCLAHENSGVADRYGLFKARLGKEEYVILNKEGERINDEVYDEIGVFFNGRAYVKLGKETFIIDEKGEPLPDRYKKVMNFENGFAVVTNFEGKSFHIDTDGKPLYEERFTFCGTMNSNGEARCYDEDGVEYAVFSDGNVVTTGNKR